MLTYGRIDEVIFLDPNLSEELVSDGRISISVTEEKVTSIQKSGAATFSMEEVKMLVKKSMEIGKQIRKDLDFWQYLVEK